MSVPLTQVLSEIGVAVEKANIAIEQFAVDAYFEHGYKNVQGNDVSDSKEYIPLKYTIALPSSAGDKKVDVPVTALVNHNTLSLSEVDVKLKFIPGESKDGEMMVNVDSIGNYAPELTSEISLHYKSTLPSEGKARIEGKHAQVL